MPNPYVSFADTLKPYFDDDKGTKPLSVATSGQVIPVSTQQAQELALTPGGQVLAAMGAARDFATFYQSFITVFNDGAFRWVGSQSYSATRSLETLDGTRSSGECAILARAFFALWTCPRPFGLGKKHAVFYPFDNQDPMNGFVAPHPAGGVRGLGPNILHPHGAHGDPRNCLYQWGNHKVVLYKGTYYDPTYRATYAHDHEMVAFEYTAAPPQVLHGGAVYQMRVVTPKPALGWKAGDLMYFRASPQGLVGPYRVIDGWV